MTTTVLNSNDLPAILADAGVVIESEQDSTPEPAEKKADSPVPATAPTHADAAEDDDGLTADERRDLTSKMQKAIGKRHREKREAEEFAAAQYSERLLAERRAETLERELAALRERTAPPTKPDEAPAKPERGNFADESKYLDAMIQWGVDERLRARETQDRADAAQRAQQERIAAAGARIARASELIPDFQEVVSAADIDVPPAVAGYMEKSDLLAELGYHFAKNPEILKSLAALDPDQQLVKIGRIESTLAPFEANSASNGKKPSTDTNGAPKAQTSDTTGILPSKARSPAPVIAPLSGSAPSGKPSQQMSIRETIADWSKRNNANLNMRKRH